MKNNYNILGRKDEVENFKDKFVFKENLIEGRNAVIEALKSDNVTIEQIFISDRNLSGSINSIFAIAKEKKIVIKKVDKRKLDKISQTGAHQGVIAQTTPYKYCELEDILNYASQKKELPFLIILDEIEDPHNFGAIIRTAEICGVHGIIIPKRKNVGITPTVYKSSAGAVEYMRICKVVNLNTVIEKLKKKNIWVYGADVMGENYSFDMDLNSSIALVIGSEGRGISKLIKQKCDGLIKIPMMGNIASLNASVAAGILMYEILKQKIKSGIN